MLFMWFEVIIAADEWAHNTSPKCPEGHRVSWKKNTFFNYLLFYWHQKKLINDQWFSILLDENILSDETESVAGI